MTHAHILLNFLKLSTTINGFANPNNKEKAALRQAQEILEEMKTLDKESADISNSILELI